MNSAHLNWYISYTVLASLCRFIWQNCEFKARQTINKFKSVADSQSVITISWIKIQLIFKFQQNKLITQTTSTHVHRRRDCIQTNVQDNLLVCSHLQIGRKVAPVNGLLTSITQQLVHLREVFAPKEPLMG